MGRTWAVIALSSHHFSDITDTGFEWLHVSPEVLSVNTQSQRVGAQIHPFPAHTNLQLQQFHQDEVQDDKPFVQRQDKCLGP